MSESLLFPGQGSHERGMQDFVEAVRPDLLALARDVIGADPFVRFDEGTAFQQPAIYCGSLAALTDTGHVRPGMVAGHSLGEFAALVAAGSISEQDGLYLVAQRGRLMQRAGELRPGTGMIAVEGGLEVATAIARQLNLAVANDNAPDQVVLAGDLSAVAEARSVAKQHGLRAARLPVAAGFHSPAMESAVDDFRATLARVTFRPPRVLSYCSITAAPFDDIPLRLLEAITSRVRWRETLRAMRAAGADRFVEVGPGRVLTGLVQRTLPDVFAATLSELTPSYA
jgi:[acyl-carrier-protein] S-malonyltransferase